MVASENTKGDGTIKTTVGAVLLLWLVLTFILGAGGSFVRQPGAPPLPILAGALVPILVFLAAFRFSGSFRDFIMAIDLQTAAAIQAWRFAGFVFIALYAYDVLPGSFAWPAGLGDMAIGITAVWVMVALRERKDFARSRVFLIWNLLGVLDLVVALGMGGVSATLGLATSGGVTMVPMARLPLVLIPAYLVPICVMLHLASLFQAGHLGATGRSYRWSGSPARRGPTQTPA